MSALRYWVWLSERHGLRSETVETLLEHFEDPRGVYFAAESELISLSLRPEELETLRDKSLEKAQNILRRCTELDVQIVTRQDAIYPNRLKNIPDPPLLLYVSGRLPAIDEYAAIAIVGTRGASPYGIKMGMRMGYELTKGGALILSGLAEGVDSAGAEGALRAGGSCVGVLGTAIDRVYPSFNRRLFEDVHAVGALISEYPPGAPMQRGSFPRRNRILSGLSVGVVVIEAPEKSGALITAADALEQGRDLFAVPGNADSPNCVGSNALLRDCAKAVTGGSDVLCEYMHLFSGVSVPDERTLAMPPEREGRFSVPAAETAEAKPETLPEKQEDYYKLRQPNPARAAQNEASQALKSRLEQCSETQLKLIAAMTEAETHIDDIINASGVPAQQALAEMTMLELDGLVSQHAGKRFSLNIRRG